MFPKHWKSLLCLICAIGLCICACGTAGEVPPTGSVDTTPSGTPDTTPSGTTPSTTTPSTTTPSTEPVTVPPTTAPVTVPPTTTPSTTPPTSAPLETKPAVTAQTLVGDWYFDAFWGDCLQLTTYRFNSDGTFSYQDSDYFSHPEASLHAYNTCWWSYEEFPDYQGTYTVQDGQLILSYSVWDEYSGDETLVTKTFALEMDGDVLFITDGQTGKVTQFSPGTQPPENATLPQVTLHPICGSWITVKGSGNRLETPSLQFRGNGKFIFSPMEYHYVPDPESGKWSWQIPGMGFPSTGGVYTVSGDQLTITSMYDDFGDYANPDVSTYTFRITDDGRLYLNDRVYVKSELWQDESIETLCGLVGAEYAPTEEFPDEY